MIYLIGSLKHDRVLTVGRQLRDEGFEVFEDWHATAPDADKHWTHYERVWRGRNFPEALRGEAAINQFEFDRAHLHACKAAVLVMPAGKSAHMELGYVIGQGKPGLILLDKEPEEFDLMYALADEVCYTVEEVVKELRKAGV